MEPVPLMYEDLSRDLFLDESDQFARTVSPAQMLQRAEMRQRRAQQDEYAAHDRELFKRLEDASVALDQNWREFRGRFFVHVIGLNYGRCTALLARRGFRFRTNFPWPVVEIDLVRSVESRDTSDRTPSVTRVPPVRKRKRVATRAVRDESEDEDGDADMAEPVDKRLMTQEELDDDMNDLSSVHEVKRRRTGSPVANSSSSSSRESGEEEGGEEDEEEVEPLQLPSPPTKAKPASEGEVHN